jgi:tetratricopeptide (TPR) repeat protein
MRFQRLILVLFLLSLPFSSVGMDEAHHHSGGGEMEGLGKVSFPTSCSPDAQKPFDRAVALLHSFQYEESKSGFADAAQKDTQCAMAFWGQAMSLYHELWEHPDAGTIKNGSALIDKAKAIGAKTPREREFIDAVAAFYEPGDGLDYTARSSAYVKAMEGVYNHNPNDGEAAAFYALSLIALPAHDPDLANRKKAIAILDKLFTSEPDHPGVIHYLIHASDTPQLAPLGLEAARRYARIAPSSAHALHMPSHIFTRLGLWQESIESNVASAAAAEKMTARHLEGASYQLHAMDFLSYAYLQSGQDAKAARTVDEVKSVPGATAEELMNSEIMLAARDSLELHQWKEAASLATHWQNDQMKDLSAGQRIDLYAASAVGAARSGDAKGARVDLEKLKQAHAEWRAKNKGYAKREDQENDLLEAEAWLAFAEGRTPEAVKLLGNVADEEDKKGVDSLTMPAREMLGDMLLGLHESGAALAAFEASLAEAPNRFDSLYGAAQAAEFSGAQEKAKSYYAKLVEVCSHGDSGRPELHEAKTYLAQTHGSAGSDDKGSKREPR